MRGLAALEVVLTHVRGGNWVEFGSLPSADQNLAVKIFFMSTRLGHEAVMIFFVLSGFLVGGKVIARVRAGRFSIKDYAIDRCTRILVPLVPACFLTVFINFMVFGDPVNVVQTLGNALALNGVLVDTLGSNAPLWSLAFEAWFYVLAGAVGRLFTAGPSPLALLAILLATLVFAKLGALYLLLWAAGALTTQFIQAAWTRRLFAPGLAMLTFGVIAHQLGATSKSFSNLVLVPPTVAETMICLGFCACIPYLSEARINQMLEPAGDVIKFLSQISFSLYLVHYPINAALCVLWPKSDLIGLTSVEYFAAKTITCILAASLFWLIFERTSFFLRRIIKAQSLEHSEKLTSA